MGFPRPSEQQEFDLKRETVSLPGVNNNLLSFYLEISYGLYVLTKTFSCES